MDHILTALLTAEPSAVAKTAIKVGHLVGIVLGLGSATILDLIVLRFLIAGKVEDAHVSVMKFASGIVTVGLALLWLSGSAYLLHYWAFDPEKLANPKVWAKIAIVGVLTLNGVFIHKAVLPLVDAQRGRSLFDGVERGERAMLLVFGTVSATSWYAPLILGATPQLNFVVPAVSVLSAYAIVLLVAIVVTQGIANSLWRREEEARLHAQTLELQRLAAELRARLTRRNMALMSPPFSAPTENISIAS